MVVPCPTLTFRRQGDPSFEMLYCDFPVPDDEQVWGKQRKTTTARIIEFVLADTCAISVSPLCGDFFVACGKQARSEICPLSSELVCAPGKIGLHVKFYPKMMHLAQQADGVWRAIAGVRCDPAFLQSAAG